MTKQAKDKLYSNKHGIVGNFKFDAAVVDVFEDMISRSVPGYRQIISFISTITKHYQQDNHQYYDLGCSLGAGMLAMGESLNAKNSTIIGIDTSDEMLKQAQQAIDSTPTKSNTDYKYINEDIGRIEINQAAMVLMNFTLQFIPLEQRQQIIERIYQGLSNNGVLLLSEKVQFDDQKIQTVLTDLHHQFKADQGYSELEISQKRDAIENVLIPEKLETHIERLHNAGFKTVTPWFQNFQFFSLIAIK